MDRDTLAIEHFPFARIIAHQMARRLSTEADISDLEGAAAVGLLHAAGKFNPSYGTSFKVFAKHRIRGAIMDDLRRIDWMNRHERNRCKKRGESPPGPLSLDNEVWTGSEAAYPATQFDELEIREIREIVGKAVDSLPRMERIVIILRFWDDKPFDQIARILGCHPNRPAVLAHRARKRLRKNLAGRWVADK